MKITANNQIREEGRRLFEKLQHVGWTENECEIYAPLTLEINQLKKEKNAIILAHSYQSPEIVSGVADFVGDSYGLSRIASEHEAKTIIFCSVYFMAETAKIMSPEKTVLVPSRAGCSLADSITAQDVITLRRKHPRIPVITYINTSAEVRAESDICVTSSNVIQIIEAVPEQSVIFIPDKYMADYVRRSSKKKIIGWDGVCVVHETFTADSVKAVKALHAGVQILVHPECSAGVIDEADFVGSTSAMIDYVKKSEGETFMVVSECGLADRLKIEEPSKKIVGACSLCPYMKQIQLKDIRSALKAPRRDQIVEIPEETLKKAKKCLERMFEMTRI